MEWLKNNLPLLVLVLALVGVAGYALLPMLTLTKEKCVFIVLEDKANVKMPGMELTGPSKYESYAPGCGYPEVKANSTGGNNGFQPSSYSN